MTKTKKKICLLLAGGTWTVDKAKNMLAVNNTGDVDLWLNTMPELGILSAVETEFVVNEEAQLSFSLWEKLATLIIKKEADYDGFVVVTKAERAILTATVLNFLLQNFKKTIVVTASQMSGAYTKEKKEIMQDLIANQGGLGLRSNLINAVQVAGEELAQVAVMFGSRLVAGIKAKLEYQQGKYVLSSVDDDYLAKIDFGISYKNNLAYSKNLTKKYQNLSRGLCIIDDYLQEKNLWPKEAFVNYQAVLVFLHDEELSLEQIKYFKSLEKTVILYHPQYLQQEKDFSTISSCTKETVIAKVLWLMANVAESDWPKMLKANLIDEFVNFKK
ncbi:asparaginase [Candidatus Nomurabacteria bacterium]|nr:asparaginase [Candidatus Nomurabacteria bacterium]